MATQSNADASKRGKNTIWHASADEHAWVEAVVADLRVVLQAQLETHASTWLMLSGGTTPAPVYSALATQPLDWSRVVVSLVDDRDVDPNAKGSNERLVRQTLLRERASVARFQPLHRAGQALNDAVRASNESWPLGAGDSAVDISIAVAVLGMGDDGHTASLFPGAVNLDAAFASTDPYVAIDATGCAVAGDWPHRISMTPSGLALARHRVLLIRGEEKRATFERALGAGEARDMPIRVAIDDVDNPLHVYWCP